MEEQSFKYDVALSFAEEDRRFVELVAETLVASAVKVYYDEYHRVDTWGKDLYDQLNDVYRNKARYCVMIISRRYKRKQWTNYERKSAQARALLENRDYILPFRLDKTKIPGLPDSKAYLSIWTHDYRRLSQAILWKLQHPSQPWESIGPLYATGMRAAMSSFLRHLRERLALRTPQRRIRATFLAILLGSVGYYELADRLTPVPVLAKRLYERSWEVHKKAVCKDGQPSPSSGSGTCSHHGGVDHYIITGEYRKTMEQCQQEAIALSWLPYR